MVSSSMSSAQPEASYQPLLCCMQDITLGLCTLLASLTSNITLLWHGGYQRGELTGFFLANSLPHGRFFFSNEPLESKINQSWYREIWPDCEKTPKKTRHGWNSTKLNERVCPPCLLPSSAAFEVLSLTVSSAVKGLHSGWHAVLHNKHSVATVTIYLIRPRHTHTLLKLISISRILSARSDIYLICGGKKPKTWHTQ